MFKNLRELQVEALSPRSATRPPLPPGKLKMANCTITEWVPLYDLSMSNEEMESHVDLNQDGEIGSVPLMTTDLNLCTAKSESPEAVEYCKIVMRMYMMRRPNVWFYNCMLPTFLITTLSVTAFAIGVDSVDSRAQAGLTALLTIVAIKFSVAGNLPVLPYLTMLDQYLLYCIFFTSFTVAYVSILPWLCRNDTDTMNQIDAWVLVLAWCSWGYTNVTLYSNIVTRVNALRSGEWKESKWGESNQIDWFFFTSWIRDNSQTDLHKGNAYDH